MGSRAAAAKRAEKAAQAVEEKRRKDKERKDRLYVRKTPGDVDDYDMSGYKWVLKSHFNASTDDTINRNAFTLEYEDYDDKKKDLTEKVLEGLKELQDPNGRRR